MTPGHVAELRETKEALQRVAAHVAEAVAIAAQAKAAAEKEVGIPEHDHPGLAKVEALQAEVGALGQRIAALEARPPPDLTGLAPAGHRHPELVAKIDGVAARHPSYEDLSSYIDEIQTLEVLLAEYETARKEGVAKIEKLEADLKFVRQLAEGKGGSPTGHGNHLGGATHSAVSSRLAGFMTPDQLRKLEQLWAAHEAAPGG